MNNKHRKTLIKVFSDPVKAGILRKDIESLFLALGGEISEGNGSRIRIELNEVLAAFHRPHPYPHMDKGALKSVRRFLTNAGVKV